ncbi:MAG: SWIM zinc finger domain-containing protein, partial [Gemmataceae bacterium]|nr:SWIM zinc finger domain-containing protein [Gemmataceae bacterium]
MLREEQIVLRQQRATSTQFEISNCGKNRVFSTFRVRNPASGGEYEVVIRGFEIGDNWCNCPDYRVNTLGTCKHIEAVLEKLRQEVPDHLRKRKAPVTQPEIYLRYKEQLQLAILLPPRRSDGLQRLADEFFSDQGLWRGGRRFSALLQAIDKVPEQILVRSDALDYIDREIERDEMLAKEQQWLALLEAGRLPWTLLRVPLYDYQLRGAIFLACRGRSILGDDMG